MLLNDKLSCKFTSVSSLSRFEIYIYIYIYINPINFQLCTCFIIINVDLTLLIYVQSYQHICISITKVHKQLMHYATNCTNYDHKKKTDKSDRLTNKNNYHPYKISRKINISHSFFLYSIICILLLLLYTRLKGL